MHKLLAVLTVIITIITTVLGLAAYVGVTGAYKYHLIAGLLTLVAALAASHQLYHGNMGRK
ncbi:hypothetical protein [Desulfoscipio gibsoniae]|uniref:Uncharacterized protein n=1 Tax=Desulfoscipio gibsoniae DSM 7213 TaxID=767817 RepID=R4KCQ4_9FIRM|nr:hypothetical protein [Desulfoscipio gibsoniae]AGL00958.1 hypothetical protein Desgi_1462 [Desulfoscipio gibsoniae DSM 7213]